MSGPTILLVHGAWCGEWAYWRLGPSLDQRGLAWVGADLPTCRAADAAVGPLDDVAYLRELLAGIDRPVIAVGKSYGGVVISGASAGCPNVQHLVYVAGGFGARSSHRRERSGMPDQPLADICWLRSVPSK